jgi:transposase
MSGCMRTRTNSLQFVQSQVLQQTLKRLEKAFVSMWEQNHGFLRFKKAGNMRSFVFPQLGVNPVHDRAVKLPKIGLVKFHQSRSIPDGATVKQARIVRRISGWIDARKTSQICPNCGVETGKKELSERTHSCSSCGYTTDSRFSSSASSSN